MAEQGFISWKWLGKLKLNNGGFRVCVGGEEDVRYVLSETAYITLELIKSYRPAYCAMTMMSLLGLPLELPANAPARSHGLTSFLSGLPEYISRCQPPKSAV